MRDVLEKKIAELKSGRQEAFDYIYEHTHRAVYFSVLKIVRDKMHAEDILQETFLRAVRALDQYRTGTNFVAWIRQIGRSLAYNHLKKYRREVTTDFEADAHRYGTRETELPYIFDLAAEVLPDDEYEIVMLCQVAGYKRREAAHMLGLPIGTVTWKNNRALAKLRQILEKEDAV